MKFIGTLSHQEEDMYTQTKDRKIIWIREFLADDQCNSELRASTWRKHETVQSKINALWAKVLCLPIERSKKIATFAFSSITPTSVEILSWNSHVVAQAERKWANSPIP